MTCDPSYYKWTQYIFLKMHEAGLVYQRQVGTMYIHPIKELFKRKICIIFLPINLNMCFGCSKEPSH